MATSPVNMLTTSPVNLVDAIATAMPRTARANTAIVRIGVVADVTNEWADVYVGQDPTDPDAVTIQASYHTFYVPKPGDVVSLLNDGDRWLVVGAVASQATNVAAFYPVGSIYLSTAPDDPATIFGFGTWVQIQNRFLIGAGGSYAPGATGGTTAIGVANMPSHTHTFSDTTTADAHSHNVGRDHDGAGGSAIYTVHDTGSSGAAAQSPTSSDSHTHSVSGTTSATGSGTAFINPYFAVYMWQRTA